jgi:hypothetical protein
MNAGEDVRLLVFAAGSVTGGDPAELHQGFAALRIDADTHGRTVELFSRYDEEVDVSEATFLITATLLVLGARAEPGATLAYLRVGAGDESSAIYHEAAGADEVASMLERVQAATAIVPGYPGQGWLDPATARLLVWGNDSEPVPVDQWPVNVALRAVGVRRGDHPDESAALGLTLPHHPSTVDDSGRPFSEPPPAGRGRA